MADYAKITVKAVYSENADYSDPEFETNLDPDELVPDEGSMQKVEAATGGTTVTVSAFGTAKSLIVQNLDETNYVDVTFDSVANSSVDNILRLGPKGTRGRVMVIPDVTVAQNITLTADTAACLCKLVFLSAK